MIIIDQLADEFATGCLKYLKTAGGFCRGCLDMAACRCGSQVDASYSSKYSYSAEGSSLLRTKLSPVPPPPILEERIRAIVEQEAERRRLAGPQPAPTPTP